MAHSEPIAIIGMSCRYPNSNNPLEFWQLLAEGRDGIGPVPQDRIEKRIISPSYKYSQANYLPIAIDEFDARFFQVSPKTATFMDPQLRLLLEVAWEALEDSSVNPESLRGTTAGIFVGSWLQDYQKIGMLSPDKDFFLVYMGNSMAARMAFFLGTLGPAIDSESACSSSMVAVHLACQSLRDRSTSLALVGGVNLLIEPPSGTDLDIGFATSLDGRCKSFDKDADGYGRAEGCGVLILKRLSDAIRDEDKILALIKGSAISQEGLSRSMGTPTVHSEALAMSLALKNAGVDPVDVSYIEAHGTGTKVGDPIEIAAIEKVYSSKSRITPLIIGTVKANVGHSEACSGITSIIKVILSLQYKIIPKHLNFNHCNPDINFEKIPAILPMKNMEWSTSGNGQPRIAGVSSFGISGTDCHLILQEFVEQSHVYTDKLKADRPLHIMTLSAKTAEALESLIGRYFEYFQTTENKLRDIAYTANTGRALFDHRLVIVTADKAKAGEILKRGNYFQNRMSDKQHKPKICMLFPGQGSHYPGMAKELYKGSPTFQENFDECCKIILEEAKEKIDLKLILWGDESGVGDMLNKSVNSQVAIFCVDYCLFKLWGSWGIKPDYVLGHSLGESAAVVAVGVRDLREGLKALLLKCQLVDELAHGKMIAVRVDQSKARSLISEFKNKNMINRNWLDVAAVNSPEQTVLSGETDCIDEFHKFCVERGVKSTIIASSHAFHSRMLDPVLNEIKRKLATIHQSSVAATESGIKYISSSEAKVIDYDELLQEDYWVANTRNTVQFMEACKVARNEGCEIFLELGAQPILSALVRANWNDNPNGGSPLCLPSLRRNENNWETLLNSLAQLSLTTRGNEINWRGFDQPYLRRKVSLPHYPFIRKGYWINKTHLTSLNSSSDISFNQVECGHPLLGFKMNIASDNVHIFQHHIDLAQENMKYFKEHSIGKSVIFPGAGFLEMILAAGKCTIMGEEKVWEPVSLENFKISCPLQLETGRSCRLQIIGRITQAGKCEVKVSHFTENVSDDASGHGRWLDHVTSTFGVTNSSSVQTKEELSGLNLISVKKNWTNSDLEITQLYQDQLPQIGLHFGPSFQTLKNAWRDPNDSRSIMLALKIESTILKSMNNYHIHPLIGDGMIQSTLLLLPANILHVPVSIKRFTLVEAVVPYQNFYVFCKRVNTGVDEDFTVSLLNEEGVLLASMEGLKMHGTTVKNVEARLASDQGGENTLPKFWKEEWTPSNRKVPKEKFTSASAGQSIGSKRWMLIGSDSDFSERIQTFSHNNGEGEMLLLSEVMNNDKLYSKEVLFKFLDDQVASTEGIVYLNGLCKKEESQERICLEFLLVCQWLQENYHLSQVQSLKVAVITHGLQFVEGTDEVFNPAPATLGGMINTLKSECPKLSTKWIDLSSKPTCTEQIPNICKELLDVDGWKEGRVALRYERRYVAKFIAVPTPKIDANKGDNSKEVPLFKNRCRTYMVTGGLSGLGFQVASWMLENGARHMILVGRSSPKPEVSKLIKEWNESGKRVHIFNADVGNWNECDALFNWIEDSELPPLRGIFHCAGVLADASISNQTWKNFETVFGPKVNGSWNLHTLALYYQLDYFVMFSSISSLFGIPGQINYSAGNCYEDAVARYRHSLGLPATAINWGNWEEIGMASHHEFPGLKPISVQQGLQALELILKEGIQQIAVANFYSFKDFAQLCPRAIGYVDEKLIEGQLTHSQSSRFAQKANENLELGKMFRKDMVQVTEKSEKSLIIQKYIDLATRSLLKMDISETIDINLEFHSMGIDSLMMMELRDKLQEIFGNEPNITPTHLRDFPSVGALSDKLAEQLN